MPTMHSDSDPSTMSFGDHLEELRRRMLYAVAAPLPLFIVLFLFSDTIVKWLLLPAFQVLHQHGLPADLQLLSPPEFLLTKLKLSIIAALVLSAPWILLQAWHFIAPGLYTHERRFAYFLLPGSFLLSMAGIALLYWVMLPLMLKVLVMLAANVEMPLATVERPPAMTAAMDAAEREGAIAIRIAPPDEMVEGEVWFKVPENILYVALLNDEGVLEPVVVAPEKQTTTFRQSFRMIWVVNFVLVLLLGIVVAFQMPLVIVLLGWLGLVSSEWLRAHRKYALVICGIIAAVITPADAFSMVMMLIPLYLLYELGILLLVLLPASAVAEGRIGRFRFSRAAAHARSGKSGDPDKRRAQSPEPAQPDATIPRTKRNPQSPPESTDREDEH